jgi:hypothetical protein
MDRHRLGLIDRYTLVALDVLLGYQKRYASLSLPFASLSQMIGCNLEGLDTRQSVRPVLLAFQTAQHAFHKTWTSHPAYPAIYGVGVSTGLPTYTSRDRFQHQVTSAFATLRPHTAKRALTLLDIYTSHVKDFLSSSVHCN